ncbi:MAG: 2-phosphosulfolactate phosphatase [Gemmatimonadota bacterium]
MTLDVVFTPLGLVPGDVTGRTVLVVDVLRATTTMCAALHHGARAVVVAADIEDATRLAHTLDPSDVLLAGERNCLRIPGFQLGNSPGEMTAAQVRGKTLVMTTTNGTRALLATSGARDVILAAAVNLSAAGATAAAALESGTPVTILCAGRDHGFGMDDAYLAGRLVVAALRGRRTRKGLNDAALVAVDMVRRYGDGIERVFALSHAGRDLKALGLGDDVVAAAAVDSHPVVPRYRDRRIALAATAKGRA